MQPVKWSHYAADATFTLVHIKCKNTQDGEIQSQENASAYLQQLTEGFLKEEDITASPRCDTISVSQGGILAVGILIKPLQNEDVTDTWFDKYRDYEMTTYIPAFDDDTELLNPRRIDTFQGDHFSLKHTVTGTKCAPYVMHFTVDNILVHANMLHKSLPLMAYLNHKDVSDRKAAPLLFVGEVMVKENLHISTFARDNAILVMLTNTDVKQDIEIEDTQISYSRCKKPNVTTPFTIESENKVNLLFSTDTTQRRIVDERTKLFVKWSLKHQPLGRQSVWTTLCIGGEA